MVVRERSNPAKSPEKDHCVKELLMKFPQTQSNVYFHLTGFVKHLSLLSQPGNLPILEDIAEITLQNTGLIY